MGNTQFSFKQISLNALKQARELGIEINHLYDEMDDLRTKSRKMEQGIKDIQIPKLVEDLDQLAQLLGERENLKKLRSSVNANFDQKCDQLRALKSRFRELVPLGVWIKCEDYGVGYFGGNPRDPIVMIEPWQKLQKDPSLPLFAESDSLA